MHSFASTLEPKDYIKKLFLPPRSTKSNLVNPKTLQPSFPLSPTLAYSMGYYQQQPAPAYYQQPQAIYVQQPQPVYVQQAPPKQNNGCMSGFCAGLCCCCLLETCCLL
ncbi:hypothetical protein TBLA_0E02545 [Henningerozyma blattae CBS 6284]|uniref:Cysteine-rich transmembrane CYSTM domain-containing protein n=1 Tax=Henningerozyma blattae (strain ATCC 34711 / CBS 6284 / DSM 70876 / NBRC 10599 / NRRL Y-10934 / UCD 77-7) TaxID=1071380 RepID=I2H4K8_HENB6|nr:hypothetical protein TBLA_0E02545 [Tetrapisispora blattae CBS 6284]CCH61310.1 hypothetical protein TBLA_0E02545 [Tetrapisispora blattae CBS 6284]